MNILHKINQIVQMDPIHALMSVITILQNDMDVFRAYNSSLFKSHRFFRVIVLVLDVILL